VMAVPDDIREEEVMACVVLRSGLRSPATAEAAQALFAHCDAGMAYYKAPGWIWFTDHIPTTGTQKIQKHAIFPADVDPRALAGVVDLRSLKKKRR